MTHAKRTILITGCSSGIGYHCAHALRARGWRVFASCRQQADCDRLAAEGFEAPRLDYDDTDSIAAGLDAVLSATGGTLDAVFNNGAGAWDNNSGADWHFAVISNSTPQPPAQPILVTATPVSSSQINLSWSASAYATGYIVQRGGSPIGTAAGTTYGDSGLVASTVADNVWPSQATFSRRTAALPSSRQAWKSSVLSASTRAC